MNPASPPPGPRRLRLAFLVSVAAGASLALAVELIFLALRGSPAETPAAFPVVAVVVSTAGLIIAASLARREEKARRQGERVVLIGDPGIDTLADEAVLSVLATRLREALRADQVVVLLQAEGSEERPTQGAPPSSPRDFEVVAEAGLDPAGSRVVAAACYPANAAAGVGAPPSPLPAGWAEARTTLTEPITREGGVVGMVYVAWLGARPVSPDDEGLAALAAGRVSSVVHRRQLVDAERRARLSAERARHQLAVLADGGPVLASALNEYSTEVAALAEVCVPAFADLCAIDLVDDGGRVQAAAYRAAAASNVELPSGGAWRALLDRAFLDGHSRFGYLGAPGNDELAGEALALLGASSVLVVPVQAGGLSLGTITMATGAKRRGFRPSDVSVAEDLASRLAVAIQRVQLHREAVASAEAQARTARRLRRLTDAAITLAGTTEPERLLNSAAAEARRVVAASAALVVYRPADQPEHRVRCGDDSGCELEAVADAAAASATLVARDGCLAAPLLDRHRVCRGALAVAARPDATLNVDDEVALVSLAHLVALVVGQAELMAAVAVREARMQSLVDASPLAILRLSPDADVLEGNPAARQLFGWDAGSATGPLPEALNEQLRDLAVRAAQGEATRDALVQGLGPAGQTLDLSVAAAPMRDDSGGLDAVLLVVADVSERRRAERQLQQAQRLEAMGQVAGGVAHDFNNLLMVIVGYTEAVLASVEDDDPVRPLLESIDRAGASAAALTNQLLGLAGRRAAVPMPVEPATLVRSLEPVVRRLAGVDIDVVVDVAPVGTIVADPSELEQVVLNLAINARDAMPSGGRLEVTVGLVELTASEADRHRVTPGTYVQLSVADSGTGMDEETLSRCFEPFFTRKERGRGTGLGLAAVYATATECGGTVTVSSREGHGTTFRVLLPRSGEEAESPVEVVAEDRPFGTGRVLLVDDEAEIRELARQGLVDSGFTVVAAANAASAIAAFEQAAAPFDVLVTDVVMPGMRGTELAGRLLALQPTLEVLYISGYAGVGPEVGETIDGVGVLRKPFRIHELCGRVARLGERARGARLAPPQGSKR